MAKSNLVGEGLFCLHFHFTICHQRESGQKLKQKPGGRNPEIGANVEALEELPTGLFVMVCLSRTLYQHPRSDPTHNGLDPPTSVTN